MSGKRISLVAVLACLAMAAGCAKERQPRSYLQPNIIKKSDLTGEWYHVPTTVDIGYGSAVTFIGEAGWDMSIIKWDIQEHVLYARLAYDRIRNTEGSYNSIDGLTFKGEPIGAWSVKHFDIIRDYNPTTGEEINVLKESTERPWYEREFLRVDWSDNLISNWNLLWQRAATVDPIPYFETDPNHPHSPKLDRDENGTVTYIGITHKVLVTPDTRPIEWDFMGLSAIPDCFFYGSTTSCTSTEVTMRLAFARKDPDHEYSPREYTQVEQDNYGYFLTQRLNYNRDRGVTVGGIKWYANTFNLYSEWFQKAYDVGTASVYAGGRDFSCPNDGTPCRYTDDNSKVFVMGDKVYSDADVPSHIATGPSPVHCRNDGETPCFYVHDGTPVFREDPMGTERVVLRPRDRPLKPVVYFLNDAFPNQLLPTVRNVAGQWAEQLNRTVWLAAGCSDKTFGTSQCPTRPEFNDPAFSMLILCENPTVQESDPPECGPVGRTIQLGDIRVSHIVWIDAPQQSSPLGYGPPLPDPITGETISAIANIYGAPLDSYSNYATEVVRMLTDSDFGWEDYLFGRWQADFVKRNLAGGFNNAMPEPAGRNKVGDIPQNHKQSWRQRTYTKKDLTRLHRQMNFNYARAVPGSANPPPAHATKKEIQAWVKSRVNSISRTSVLGNGTNPQLARVNMLRNTYFEDLLMTPDHMARYASTLQAAGYDPLSTTGADIPKGSALRAKVSPLNRLNVRYLRAINRVKMQHYRQTVMYPEMVPFQEPSVVGVATEMVCGLCCADNERDAQGNCPAATDACKADIAQQTAKWAADETKCYDSIKHRLRELIFDGVTLHEMGHNMGLRHNFKGSYDAMNFFDRYWEIRKEDGSIGPRTTDPMTPFERLNKITQYQYTSIMDYGGKFNSDFEGLGRYDTAAIHHAYSRFTQVFQQVNDVPRLSTVQNFASFSWPTPAIFYFAGPEAINYTEFHYDPTVAATGIVDTTEQNRDWVPRDWIRANPLFSDAQVTDQAVEQKAGGTAIRFMVPYKFCSDEFRNSSLGCNLFDEGADLYEITENQIQAYENYYIFNNFGRDRYSFGWNEDYYPSRIVSRYFDIMQNHLSYYVLYATIFHDWGIWTADQVQTFLTDPDKGWGTFTAAVARTFETFTRVLFQPRPGCYVERQRPDGTNYFFMDTDPEYCTFPGGQPVPYSFQIDQIDGKYWDDSWNFDLGYQWYLQQTRIGHFLDRPLAIQMMAYASNNFLGRDTQEDVRAYTINYSRLFPQHINVLFSSIQSGDLSILAPSYCGNDANGVAIVEHRDVTNLDAPRCTLTGGTFQGYIDPGDTFTTQLNSAVFGMSMFPMNYSQEFIDKSRIYVVGQRSGPDFSNLPAGAQLVEFVDPFSGKTYRAVRYADVALDPLGNTYSPSIGARTLDQAQLVLDRYNTAVGGGDPNEIFVAEEDLKNFIINLDMMASLSYRLEHPEYGE